MSPIEDLLRGGHLHPVARPWRLAGALTRDRGRLRWCYAPSYPLDTTPLSVLAPSPPKR